MVDVVWDHARDGRRACSR